MAALALAVFLALLHHTCWALNNGLALRPVLGYNTWTSYNTGINETLIQSLADQLVTLGLRDAGYTYLCIDGASGVAGRQAVSHIICGCACQLLPSVVLDLAALALRRWLGSDAARQRRCDQRKHRPVPQRHERALCLRALQG